MVHKHDDMRNFHKERLEKQGLTQVEPEFYSMNAQTEDEPTFSGQATQTDYQTMDQGTQSDYQTMEQGTQTRRKQLVYERGVGAFSLPAPKQLSYQRGTSVSIAPVKKQLSYAHGSGGSYIPPVGVDASAQATMADEMEEDEADKATIGYLSDDIADDEEMPTRASQQKRSAEIKDEKKKKIKLEEKIKQEAVKIKQEGSSSSSSALVPVAAPLEDEDIQTMRVNFNNNTDMAFWEASSGNEIKSQLNLRFPDKVGDWKFKNKSQLVSIVRGLIRKNQWVKGSAPASSSTPASTPASSNTPALDPNDDDIKVTDVTWDKSKDLDYWSEQSANYIRSNLARHFPEDRMKYSFFKKRQEYIDYISNLIKQGKW